MTDSVSKRQNVDGLRPSQAPDPCCLVIFGASGDLTQRKLVPAVYNLLLDGLVAGRIRGRRHGPTGIDRQRPLPMTCGRASGITPGRLWTRRDGRPLPRAPRTFALGKDPSGYRRLAKHLDGRGPRAGNGRESPVLSLHSSRRRFPP